LLATYILTFMHLRSMLFTHWTPLIAKVTKQQQRVDDCAWPSFFSGALRTPA